MKFLKRVVATLFALFNSLESASAENLSIKLLAQDQAPKYTFSPYLGGLCGEIYIELKKRLEAEGIAVELPVKALPMKRILSLLQAGEGHAYCGAGGRGTNREWQFVYSSEPLYNISMVTVVHAEDALNFKTIHDLGGTDVMILTPFGTSTASWLKKQGNLRVDDRFQTLDQAIRLVAEKRWGRVVYYHDLGLLAAMERAEISDNLRIQSVSDTVHPQWMLYSRQLPAGIRARFEAHLQNMRKTGFLQAISGHYTLPEVAAQPGF